MRIALDTISSSASTSEVELSDNEDDLQPPATDNTKELVASSLVQPLFLNKALPMQLSKGRRHASLQPNRIPSFGPIDPQDRQRQKSYSERRGPRWMRESTPKPFEGSKDDVRDANGDQSATFAVHSSSEDSETDSEEDQWPVAPKHILRRNVQRPNAAHRETSVEAQELSQRIRLAYEADEQQHRPSRRIASRRSASRRLSTQTPSPQQVRKQPLPKIQDDFAEVESLLANLRLKRDAEEKKAQQIFEQKNKSLWTTIEASIREAEQARAKAEQEEEERQKRAKEQKEAAERQARQVREEEERRTKQKQEAEEQQRLQKERDDKAKADAEAARAAEEARKKTLSASIGDGVSARSREEYEKWYAKIQSIKQDILPAISQNANWRKQCFGAKRIITRNVGQLTNSRAEIMRITNSIGEVLTQAKGASPGGEIYTWILNHLSKCLIRQAEQEVAAKQDTAFPLARVVIWLLLEGHTELGDVLMARLAKKCCWCAAYCPPKKSEQDDKTYAKVMGKAAVDEPSLQYTSRMCGIIALYFAICQTKIVTPPSSKPADAKLIPDHFRPSALWVWQARMLAPHMLEFTLTPALFSVLVEIAGPALTVAFGRQTTKLWTLLRTEGIRNGKAGFTKQQSANSAKVRLELLLDEWQKTGSVVGATTGREMEA